MGTILVKSALNALKIEVFKRKRFSLKKFNLVSHFCYLHVLKTSICKAFKALFTKIVPIFRQLLLRDMNFYVRVIFDQWPKLHLGLDV